MVKQNIIIAVIIIVLVFGGIYFGFMRQGSVTGNVVGSNGGTISGSVNSGDTKVITIDAVRWQYAPETITVKKGDKVKIIVTNKDTAHGIAIPDFGVSGADSVEFTADKTGTFEFHCPTYCGQGHKEMKGTLIVE